MFGVGSLSASQYKQLYQFFYTTVSLHYKICTMFLFNHLLFWSYSWIGRVPQKKISGDRAGFLKAGRPFHWQTNSVKAWKKLEAPTWSAKNDRLNLIRSLNSKWLLMDGTSRNLRQLFDTNMRCRLPKDNLWPCNSCQHLKGRHAICANSLTYPSFHDIKMIYGTCCARYQLLKYSH